MEECQIEGPSTPARTGAIRPLGAFMTPQPPLFAAQRPSKEIIDRRRTGPQRPPPGFAFSSGMVLNVKEEQQDVTMDEGQDEKPHKRPEVTEEERRVSST